MKKSEKTRMIRETIRKNRYPLPIQKEDAKLDGNCYAYAIGSKYEEDPENNNGDEYIYNLGNMSNFKHEPTSIEEAEKMFLADMKVLGISARKSYLKEKIENGEWKIAFFLKNDDDYDFHFVRQDKDGKWSEKECINGRVRKLGMKPKCRRHYELVGYYILSCKN